MSDAAALSSDVSEDCPSNVELAERIDRVEREKDVEIQQLQDELAEEREKRVEAEERAEKAERIAHSAVCLLRTQLKLDDETAMWNLVPTTVGDVLKGRAGDGDVQDLYDNVERLWDDVEALQKGEVDTTDLVGGVDPELPIEEDLAKANDEARRSDLSTNELRAVYVFRKFASESKSWSGNMRVDSADVRRILKNEGESNLNDNDPRRTMRMLAKKSANVPKEERDPENEENLFTLTKGDKRLELQADKEEWVEYWQELEERYNP